MEGQQVLKDGDNTMFGLWRGAQRVLDDKTMVLYRNRQLSFSISNISTSSSYDDSKLKGLMIFLEKRLEYLSIIQLSLSIYELRYIYLSVNWYDF